MRKEQAVGSGQRGAGRERAKGGRQRGNDAVVPAGIGYPNDAVRAGQAPSWYHGDFQNRKKIAMAAYLSVCSGTSARRLPGSPPASPASRLPGLPVPFLGFIFTL